MKIFQSILRDLSQVALSFSTRGIFVAVFILAIISLFIVELPPWLLDILLVTNLLIALTLLLRGLFIDNALRIFSFPSILVLTTLFRLALNVSSTKLILLHGHDRELYAAGQVIRAFGKFVVGGDFMVGAIVFAIIAVVNFVVIAKGSARVAEVAARFTLDSLPGRQLSIDTEYRSGNISREEALERREDLTRESQFFGAMDGAMKWVQGDAIAGLAITFINAIGGVSLGIINHQMAFGEAVETFGVLTIGDGLVSILPSLLISVSAGIVITHVIGRDKREAGDEMFFQMLSDPRASVIASAALLLTGFFGLVGPEEIPAFPFFLVGVVMLLITAARNWMSKDVLPVTDDGTVSAVEWGQASADLAPARLLPGVGAGGGVNRELLRGDSAASYSLEPLCLEVDSRRLARYLGIAPGGVSASEDGRLENFYQNVKMIRDEEYRQRGVILPELALRVDDNLPNGSYRVLVREQVCRSGSVPAGYTFVAANSGVLSVLGIRANTTTRHPLDNRASVWVDSRQAGLDALRHLGIEVHSPAEFLVLESVGAVFDVIDEVFGLDEAKTLLAAIKDRHNQLVSEVFESERLSYPEFAEVLRRLVRERVNIRDLKLILEGIVEFSALHSDVEDRQEWLSELHSFLRMVLSRSIVNDSVGPGDKLRTFVLSDEVEEEFRSAVSLWDYSRSKPPLDPGFEISLRNAATQIFGPVLERGVVPIVVLCPADIRPVVQDFFGRQIGSPEWIRALAYQELGEFWKPESIGVLSVQN